MGSASVLSLPCGCPCALVVVVGVVVARARRGECLGISATFLSPCTESNAEKFPKNAYFFMTPTQSARFRRNSLRQATKRHLNSS